MKKLCLVLLLFLSSVGCARLEIYRLAPPASSIDPQTYSHFTDLVVIVDGNKSTGREAAIVKKELDDVKFFTCTEAAQFTDDSSKSPVALFVHVNQRAEDNIKTDAVRDRATNEIKNRYTRSGQVYVDFVFELKDFRKIKSESSTAGLIVREYHLNKRASTKDDNPNPAPLEYGPITDTAFLNIFKKFNADVFPHYKLYVYRGGHDKSMPEVRDGQAAFVAKDYKKAEQLFQRAINGGTTNPKVQPKSLAAAYFYKGLSIEKQGDFKRAIQDYDKALDLNSNFRDCTNARESAVECWNFVKQLNGTE